MIPQRDQGFPQRIYRGTSRPTRAYDRVKRDGARRSDAYLVSVRYAGSLGVEHRLSGGLRPTPRWFDNKSSGFVPPPRNPTISAPAAGASGAQRTTGGGARSRVSFARAAAVATLGALRKVGAHKNPDKYQPSLLDDDDGYYFDRKARLRQAQPFDKKLQKNNLRPDSRWFAAKKSFVAPPRKPTISAPAAGGKSATKTRSGDTRFGVLANTAFTRLSTAFPSRPDCTPTGGMGGAPRRKSELEP